MSIPFLTIQQVERLGFTAPKQGQTLHELAALDLSQPYQRPTALQGYHVMYAMDQLMSLADYWQGVVESLDFRIHVQVFQPTQQTARGTVFLLHGYLEHSGIYQPLIREVLEQGFNVILFDLPGHGLSSGEIANIQDFDHYQQVLWSVTQAIAQDRRLCQPWLGIGQSTGGAILMHHILSYAQQRQQPLFKRVLLLSPLIRPAKSAWWHNPVGLGIVKRVKSRVPRPFRRNNHNPPFLRFVRLQDPLQAQDLGMDWILAMAKWSEQMEHYPSCRIPVWLAQGALDKTVDWQYNVAFIRHKFRLQATLMLEEASHQLINEQADIRAALTGFIPSFLHAGYRLDYYR